MKSLTPNRPGTGLYSGFLVQVRVVGALIMRELHTRYGRDNIGYLWLIGEPLMLGSVIALLHSGQKSHEGDIDPVAFTVIGYCIFIVFRGIVNRSEGTLESNAPLLYHRMVTIFDITFARSVLELAGCMMAFGVLMAIIVLLGYATFPTRPLYLAAGIGYITWISFGISLIVVGMTYENELLGRFVHPFTYFMIPLSGSIYRVEWIPQPYRDALLYIPLPHMFELARYGQFRGATLEFVDFQYITLFCMVTMFLGLVAVKNARSRVHLS